MSASVLDDPIPGTGPAPPHTMVTVDARWVIDGTEHRGAITATPPIKSGDPVDIWVTDDGQQVDEPAPLSRAATDAVLTGLTIWLSVIGAAIILLVLTRAVLNRARNTRWQHSIDNLIGHGGGHNNT